MKSKRLLSLSPLLLSASLLAGNTPPQPFGALGVLSRISADASKNQPGIVLQDAESNLLLRQARSLGFGVGNVPDGNYVGNARSRDLLLQPGASFGYAGSVGANFGGRSASRPVQLVDHALHGKPGGCTAKLNLAQDVRSGRWTKDLVVLRPDGSKDEYRVWRGNVVKASASKMQLVDDQSLIAAAAPTRPTFLENTLTPVANASSAFEGDQRLFTTPHAGVNLVRRALANFDAPMRDTDWFAGLAAKDPSVAFLRGAARDDARASVSAIKDEVGKWADRITKWAEQVKKWAKRVKQVVDVIFTYWKWFF